MMKGSLIILVFMACISFSSAQDYHKMDSLFKVLAATRPDTNRVLLLLDISYDYMDSRPDTTLMLTLNALALTRQIRFANGEINCLNNLGNVFMVTGNYPKSLEHFFQALKIAETLNEQEKVALINSNIGLLYAYQDDYKLALSYYFKSKLIAESIHSEYALLTALINIGDGYEKLNQLDSAIIYTRQAHEIAVRMEEVVSRGIALNNLGNIHSKMGEDDIAMGYYRRSIQDFIAENDDEGICEDALGMANLFKKSGKRDSTLHYAHLSLESAQRGGFTKSVLLSSSFLSDFFEDHDQIDSAYLYQKVTIAANHSLFSQEKSKELQNLIFSEKLRQQEIAAAKEEAIQRRKKNIQMTGIGTFIPAFFGMILLFRRTKVNPKIIEFLGLLGLLFLFEFIGLCMGPLLDIITHRIPVLMLLTQAAIASSLIPLHNILERWVKEKLANKTNYALPQVTIETPTVK
jgi:tetratricopeptide (TPR) repeat protein